MASERRSRFQKILAVPKATGTLWEFRGPHDIGVIGAQFRYQHQTFSHNPPIPQLGVNPVAFPAINLWWEQSKPAVNEAFGTGNGSAVSFSHTASNLPLVPGTVAITVTGTNTVLYDDGTGFLFGSQIVTLNTVTAVKTGAQGTVNYATGAMVATFNVAPANTVTITVSYSYWARIRNSYALKTRVFSELYATGDGATATLAHTMASPYVVENSVTGTSGAIKFVDNGLGAITGTGITSGTINYSTGATSVVFAVAPATGVLIYVNYESAPPIKEGYIVRSTFHPACPQVAPVPFAPATASGNLWVPAEENFVRLRGNGGPSVVELLLDSDTCDLNELQDGMQPSGDFETNIGV